MGDAPLPRRELALAAVLGAVVSAAIILAASHGDVRRMTTGDGLIYRYVASHLTTPPHAIHDVVSSRGTSLRYGRVGLPIVLWFFSFGQTAVMRFVQPIVMVASGAAATAGVHVLLREKPRIWALSPFATLGFPLAISGGFADAFAVALGIWAVVAATAQRWIWCATLLALAMLARENAGAVLVGIVVGCAMWHDRRALAILATSLLPVLGWYTFIRFRFGFLPILDPYLRVKTSTIEAPVIGIIHSITRTSMPNALVAAAFLALAIIAFRSWDRSLLWAVAAAAALQILSAGPFSFAFIGEAVRTGVFLETFLVIAFLAERLPRASTLPAHAG